MKLQVLLLGYFSPLRSVYQTTCLSKKSMYKIDLIGDGSSGTPVRQQRLSSIVPPVPFSTKVLVVVCEWDESSGDLWYRHREGQEVREARVDQKRRAAAEVDERVSWPFRPCSTRVFSSLGFFTARPHSFSHRFQPPNGRAVQNPSRNVEARAMARTVPCLFCRVPADNTT